MASNMYRDTTMEPAKARHLQVIWDNRVRKLAKQTAFSEYELQCLCLIFHKLSETYEWWGKGLSERDRRDHLDRFGFRDGTSALSGISESAALDAVFYGLDLNNRRYVTAPSWIKGLSAFKGTNVEKALMCWRAYTGGVASVTRVEMAAHARNMFIDVGQDDFDGFCKEFIDTILKDTKAFKEGFMPLPEFLDIISRKPLFMEFMMTVLPSKDALDAFMCTFSPPKINIRRRRPKPIRNRA